HPTTAGSGHGYRLPDNPWGAAASLGCARSPSTVGMQDHPGPGQRLAEYGRGTRARSTAGRTFPQGFKQRSVGPLILHGQGACPLAHLTDSFCRQGFFGVAAPTLHGVKHCHTDLPESLAVLTQVRVLLVRRPLGPLPCRLITFCFYKITGHRRPPPAC